MFDIIHAGNRDPNAWKYFKQAYISFKPKWLHGIEIDAGEFVTSAGAEVIETNQNFNYSRSLLFTWAIPLLPHGIPGAVPDRLALHRKRSGSQRLEQRRTHQ